jgi:hypothetical protein
LCKWLRGPKTEDGDQQKLLLVKDVKSGTITHDRNYVECSHFWSGLMEVKNVVHSYRKRIIGDGKKTRFREDVWVGRKPFRDLFRRIYNLPFSHQILLLKFLLKISIALDLDGPCMVLSLTTQWEHKNLKMEKVTL